MWCRWRRRTGRQIGSVVGYSVVGPAWNRRRSRRRRTTTIWAGLRLAGVKFVAALVWGSVRFSDAGGRVVDPLSPVGHAVAILIGHDAIRDPLLGGIRPDAYARFRARPRRRFRDEFEVHLAGVGLHPADVDAGVSIGSVVPMGSRYVRGIGWTLPPRSGFGADRRGPVLLQTLPGPGQWTDGSLGSPAEPRTRSCLDARWASEWARARAAASPRASAVGQSEIPGASSFGRSRAQMYCRSRPPAALATPPAGSHSIAGCRRTRTYICARDLPNELAPGISDCPTAEAEATPPPEPAPTPMPTERPNTNECPGSTGKSEPGRSVPVAWTRESLKEDWPAPVRPRNRCWRERPIDAPAHYKWIPRGTTDLLPHPCVNMPLSEPLAARSRSNWFFYLQVEVVPGIAHYQSGGGGRAVDRIWRRDR